MPRLFLIVCITLGACGADGPPEPPAAKPGVTVSGEARVGVVIR